MTTPVERDVDAFRFGTLPDGGPLFVAASFKDVDDAVAAARTLEERGYDPEQISVFMSAQTRHGYLERNPHIGKDAKNAVVVDHVELEKESKALQGAGAGGFIGGALGAVGAALTAVGTSLIIPGLGIAVAGPIVAAFAGAGAGAAAGGLVGALVGSGMSEYRARRFEELVKQGHVIVGATARTEAERNDLSEKLKDAGGTPVTEQRP
jgi:hypothetical protein